MMEIREYETGDILGTRAVSRYSVSKEELDRQFQMFDSHTLTFDGEPLIAVGVQPMWGKVVMTTVYVTRTYVRHKMVVDQVIQDWFKSYAKARRLRKMYALLDDQQNGLAKWIKPFGFTKEYTMINAGPLGQHIHGYQLTF